MINFTIKKIVVQLIVPLPLYKIYNIKSLILNQLVFQKNAEIGVVSLMDKRDVYSAKTFLSHIYTPERALSHSIENFQKMTKVLSLLAFNFQPSL